MHFINEADPPGLTDVFRHHKSNAVPPPHRSLSVGWLRPRVLPRNNAHPHPMVRHSGRDLASRLRILEGSSRCITLQLPRLFQLSGTALHYHCHGCDQRFPSNHRAISAATFRRHKAPGKAGSGFSSLPGHHIIHDIHPQGIVADRKEVG